MKEDSKTGLFLWDFYKNTAEEVAVTKGIDLDTFLTERTERGGNGVLPRIRAEGERLRLGGGILGRLILRQPPLRYQSAQCPLVTQRGINGLDRRNTRINGLYLLEQGSGICG